MPVNAVDDAAAEALDATPPQPHVSEGAAEETAPTAHRHELSAVARPVSPRATITELRESMCRWPMGDPTAPEFRFCGGRAITGLPYCTHHARVAYQPAADRRRDRRVAGTRV